MNQVNEYPPHLKRVATEFLELSEKLNDLSRFIDESEIFIGLSETEQSLLRIQQSTMMAYAQILQTRLS